MSFNVYILFSEHLNHFYIGYTALEVNERVKLHIDEYYLNKYTAKTKEWIVFHVIVCESKHQAIMMEKHIKKMKSRTYILNLKQYPEISSSLLLKYQK